MTTDLNTVALVGRLTSDPVLRTLPSGMPATKISIAVNRVVGKDNNRREDTYFLDIETYGSTASNLAKFLSKGRRIAVSGHLKYDSWKDRETGQSRSKVVIVADNVEFLDRPPSNDNRQGSQGGYSQGQQGQGQGQGNQGGYSQGQGQGNQGGVRPRENRNAQPAPAQNFRQNQNQGNRGQNRNDVRPNVGQNPQNNGQGQGYQDDGGFIGDDGVPF